MKQDPAPDQDQEPGTKWAHGLAPAVPTDLTVMPDLKGLTLREALTRLKATGAKISVSGSGIVVTQEPIAGKVVGARVTLKLVPRAAG